MKTPTIRFFLENRKKLEPENRTTKEPIMVEVNYSYSNYDRKGNIRPKPFRIALGKSIEPNKFGFPETNFKFNESLLEKKTKNNSTVRNAISEFKTAVDTLENRYNLEKIMPEPKQFKNDLLIQLNRKERLKKKEFKILDYLKSKIERSTVEVEMGKRDSITKNTIKTYNSVKLLIENYQIATKEILTFESFNKDKYWYFWEVMDDILKDKIKVTNPNQKRKQKKQEYGYLRTTLRKYQSTFIKTLKDAKEDENINTEFALNVYDKNLILVKEDSKKEIYVTENELSQIISFNPDGNEQLLMAKDYMVIACLTGMRFESMRDSKNEIIQSYDEGIYNFKYIHSKQNKTSTEVYIPLLEPVLEILNRYDNKLPEYKTNSTINKYVKMLFDKLGFNRIEIETLKTYRSGVFDLKKPLHKLITTHDCKKTFYTNLYNNGVTPTVIDSMTHPNVSTENRMAKIYNKSNMLDKAKRFVDEINGIDSEIYRF